MPIFVESLPKSDPARDLLANQSFLARETLGLLENGHHVPCRNDDAAVFVTEHEIARMDDHALAGRASQIDRLLASTDAPPSQCLHCRPVACADREVVLAEPARVANAAV